MLEPSDIDDTEPSDPLFSKYSTKEDNLYSGPSDLDESKFLSALYSIQPCIQGQVAAANTQDLVKTTLDIVRPDVADRHEGAVNAGQPGVQPEAAIEAVRESKEAEELSQKMEADQPAEETEDEAQPYGGPADNENAAASAPIEPAKPDNASGGTPGGWSWDKDYVYNPVQDKYLFHLSQYEGAPFVVSGDQLRRMVRRYSKHAGDRAWNLNEVAASEEMPADAWREIKHMLDITHQSPPHLPEDFQQEDDIEGMAADDVQRKIHEWKKFNEQKTRREVQNAAEKWHNFEGAIEEAVSLFTEEIEDYEPPTPNIRVCSSDNLEPAALVLPIHDLHYGKYATEKECGARYDRSVAEQRVHTAVDKILEQASRAARIEKIITVCGTSDYLHIDMDKPARTTSGTPQDADGTFQEIVTGGKTLAIDLLEKMAAVAPVENHYCPGNHAVRNSLWMDLFLRDHFSDREDISFSKNLRGRQYFTYGVNRGVLFHGDAPKKQIRKIGNIIAREHGFGKYTMAISGHKHFEKAEDKAGLLMHQCPSLSGSDRWTDDNLYSSLEGIQAFVLDKERGPISKPTWYV